MVYSETTEKPRRVKGEGLYWKGFNGRGPWALPYVLHSLYQSECEGDKIVVIALKGKPAESRLLRITPHGMVTSFEGFPYTKAEVLEFVRDIERTYEAMCDEDINRLAYDHYPGFRPKRRSVYVISDGEAYKIGVSVNVRRRVKRIQTSSHRTVSLCFAVEVSDADSVEKDLHEKYRDKRLSGEWFRLTRKDLADINRLLEELS